MVKRAGSGPTTRVVATVPTPVLRKARAVLALRGLTMADFIRTRVYELAGEKQPAEVKRTPDK